MATKTWTNGASNNDWNTAGNWSPSGVPNAMDTVVFDGTSVANCEYSGDGGPICFDLKLLAGYSGKLSINATDPISLLGELRHEQGEIELNSSTSSLEVDEYYGGSASAVPVMRSDYGAYLKVLQDGEVKGAGAKYKLTKKVPANATLTLQTDAIDTPIEFGGTADLEVSGTVDWRKGKLTLMTGATEPRKVKVQSGGTLKVNCYATTKELDSKLVLEQSGGTVRLVENNKLSFLHDGYATQPSIKVTGGTFVCEPSSSGKSVISVERTTTNGLGAVKHGIEVTGGVFRVEEAASGHTKTVEVMHTSGGDFGMAVSGGCKLEIQGSVANKWPKLVLTDGALVFGNEGAYQTSGNVDDQSKVGLVQTKSCKCMNTGGDDAELYFNGLGDADVNPTTFKIIDTSGDFTGDFVSQFPAMPSGAPFPTVGVTAHDYFVKNP